MVIGYDDFDACSVCIREVGRASRDCQSASLGQLQRADQSKLILDSDSAEYNTVPSSYSWSGLCLLCLLLALDFFASF